MYGSRLIRDGETGELTTIGPGGRRNDLLELATLPDSVISGIART